MADPTPLRQTFSRALIFSYANFDGSNFTLPTTPTPFVVFGFNDNGFGDDNHDDFVGVMAIVAVAIAVRTNRRRHSLPHSRSSPPASARWVWSVGRGDGGNDWQGNT